MNQAEHVTTARELMQRADQEWQDGGNEIIAAELLWGAVARCLVAVAMNEDLPHDSHGAFRRIAQHLDNVHGGSTWRSRFGAAEPLHFHYYHGNLAQPELNSPKRQTQAVVPNLLGTLLTP